MLLLTTQGDAGNARAVKSEGMMPMPPKRVLRLRPLNLYLLQNAPEGCLRGHEDNLMAAEEEGIAPLAAEIVEIETKAEIDEINTGMEAKHHPVADLMDLHQ